MLKRPIAALLVCGIAACSLPAAAQVLNATTPLHYVALPTPCRAVDTRVMLGGGTLAGGTIRTFDPAGGECSIPPNNGPIAYAMNVTVMPHGPLGFLTIWGADGDLPPNVSTLNSTEGQIKANAAIVAGGIGGQVSVFVDGTTDLVLDVSGYFTTDTASYVYVPITPCRFVDTRSFSAPFLEAGQQRAFPLANNPCLPAGVIAEVGALSLNVTAIPIGKPVAYVTIWGTSLTEPDPQPPDASTVNVQTGFLAANAAIVTMDQSNSGAVSAYATIDVNLVMDITGYFASPQSAPGGLTLFLLKPCRVLDTRPTGGFRGKRTFPITTGNLCSVPAIAQAYVLNATVKPLGVLTYLTLWPDGTNQPTVSTLNAPDGFEASNMAIVSNFDGSIDAFAFTTELDWGTDLILDVSGYFDPGP
jgi:hypothetical protein